MKDILSLNLHSFVSSVEKILMESQRNFLRTAALINPKRKTEFENCFVFKDRTLKTLLILAISSWYCEEEIGILLRYQIREETKNNSDLFFLDLCLESKGEMLVFLEETGLWHTRDFFGNVLTKNNVEMAWRSVKPKFATTAKVRKLVRRRGYKDKGSRRNSPASNQFISCTKEIKEEELKKQILAGSLGFLHGFLGG